MHLKLVSAGHMNEGSLDFKLGVSTSTTIYFGRLVSVNVMTLTSAAVGM